MKIYIWGTGLVATRCMKFEDFSKHDLLGFIQTHKTQDSFCGKSVFEPQEIAKTDFDLIIVCIASFAREIIAECQKQNIELSKVFFIDNYEWASGENMKNAPSTCYKLINQKQDYAQIKMNFPYLYEQCKTREMQNARFNVTYHNGFDLVDKENPLQTKDFSDKIYSLDYFRHRTFEFVAREINNANVKGSVAEVGVFRGDFARLINACFANKKMYLFDTFESFNKEEFKKEVEQGRCKEDFFEGFKNTSVDLVLSRMIHPEMCVIKQGFFPETAKDLMDEKFAFVSIDVDFEKSILEGLRYFYPRLEKGGAIFVHDYNNRFLEGVKVAVKTYENETNYILQKVPIADEGGTLIIVK